MFKAGRYIKTYNIPNYTKKDGILKPGGDLHPTMNWKILG